LKPVPLAGYISSALLSSPSFIPRRVVDPDRECDRDFPVEADNGRDLDLIPDRRSPSSPFPSLSDSDSEADDWPPLATFLVPGLFHAALLLPVSLLHDLLNLSESFCTLLNAFSFSFSLSFSPSPSLSLLLLLCRVAPPPIAAPSFNWDPNPSPEV